MRRGSSMTLLLVLVLATSASGQTTYRFESPSASILSATRQHALFYPSGVALDPSGNLWIADTANHVIRRLNPSGTLEIMAGVPGLYGTRDGNAHLATFKYPHGLAFDGEGNLFVADSGNGTIRRLGPDGIVETWSGNAGERGTINGDRSEARYVTPMGLAWDPVTRELWISDASDHTIRRIGSDGEVSTIAGVPGQPGRVDARGEKAEFHNPSGIALDAAGRLWVADKQNGVIRLVERDGFTSTVAGVPGAGVHLDGTRAEARFDKPTDVAISLDGIVFVTDSWSHTIRRIEGDEVTTIAGAPGQPGSNDGVGSAARFNYPLAIAVGPDGMLYVVDMLNHAVRQGTEDEIGQGRRRSVRR